MKRYNVEDKKAVSQEVLTEGDRSPLLNPFPRNGGKVDYAFPKDSQGDMLEYVKLNDLEGARALVKSNIGMTVSEAGACLEIAFTLDKNGPEFVRLLLGMGGYRFFFNHLKRWLENQLATAKNHPDVIFVLNQYLETNEIVGDLDALDFSVSLALCKPEFNHYRKLYEALGVILEEQIERELKAKNWDTAMSTLLQALGFSVGRFELPIRKSALERWLPLLNAMPVESLELLRIPNSEGRTLLYYLQQFDLRKFPNLVVREQPSLDPSTANFPEYFRVALRSKGSLEVYVRHLESRDVADIRALLTTPDADGYLALYYILQLIPDLKRYRQIEGVVGEMFAPQLATKDALSHFLRVKELENEFEQEVRQVVPQAVPRALAVAFVTADDAKAAFKNAIENLDLADPLPMHLEIVKVYLTIIDQDFILPFRARNFLLQKNAKGFSLLYYLNQIPQLDLGRLMKFGSSVKHNIDADNRYMVLSHFASGKAEKIEECIKRGYPVFLALETAIKEGREKIVIHLARYAGVLNDEQKRSLLGPVIMQCEKSSVGCVMAFVKTGHFACGVNTLIFAVITESVELVKILLAPPYNLSPYAKNNNGYSALDCASNREVRNLLDKKASQMSTPEKLVAQLKDSPTRGIMHGENDNSLGSVYEVEQRVKVGRGKV